MNIYEKLLTIQTKLNAPKNQHNKFGGFYYRSCEDILEAVKPLLKEVKAIVLVNDEIVSIGDRYYVKATASLCDTESDNAIISNCAFAREEEQKKGMDGAQVTGATSSYARKYALNGLFAIDDNKDPDDPSHYVDKQPKTLSKETVTELTRLGIKLEQVAQYVKKDIKDLTDADLKICIDKKNERLKKAK